MKKIFWGLKLFSTNTNWLSCCHRALEQGYSYVELYTVPGSLHTLPAWKSLNCPFIIHAPHSGHGVNLSNAALRTTNREFIDDARHFADTLNAPHIIVHGGMPPQGINSEQGLAQVLAQVQAMAEPRLVLENTPVKGLEGGSTSAHSPEHMRTALAGGFSSWVLDLGHAVCAANSLHRPPADFLAELIAISPAFFHITDGVLTSEKDVHRNIGKGNFPLASFLALVPEHARLTIETPKQCVDTAVDDMLALNALAATL